MATATPSAYKATSSGILTKIPAAGAFPDPGLGTTATPVASTTAQASTSGGVVPPFINQNNAYKNSYETAKAQGASQTSLDQISAAASNYRKQNGISDNDPVFGTEAGSYAIPDQQQPDGVLGKMLPVPRAAPDATPVQSDTTPAATGATPPMNNWGTTPQQAEQSAKEQAAARINQMLSAGKNSWQTGITGAKNAFDYTNKITQDNRVLRNSQFQRINSPFSGQTDYLASNMLRNDDISDTATNADYNNKVSSINQTWADLQAAAPEQQQALYDKLYQQAADLGIRADQLNLQARTADQNYQLGLGGLLGNINGQKTVPQQQLDWNKDPNNPNNQGQVLNNQGQSITNEISKLKLQNLPQELQLGLQDLENRVKGGTISNEEAKYKLNELQDPNSVTNQTSAIKLELGKIDLANAPQEAKLRIQKLTKDIAEIGKAPYRTPEEVQMAKVKLATMNEELSQLKNKPNAADPQLNSELQGLYTGLSTGKINALDASREVDQRVSMGLITPNAAATMKSFIQKFEESATSQPGQGGYKFQSSPNDLVSMTPTQLLSAWETDPTGKVAGRAMYDWRSWVTDPKGYKAGLSYELWHSKYGPKLGG